MSKERKIKTSHLFKKLSVYMKPYMGRYIFAQILGLLSIVLEMSGTIIISIVVNGLTKGNITLERIIIWAVLYLGISVLLSASMAYIQKLILLHIGQNVVFSIREDIYNHIVNMSLSDINEIPVGKLITRLTSDANAVNELFTKTLTMIIRNLVTTITALVIMAIISIRLSVIILCITPVILFITYMFSKYSKYKYRIIRESYTEFNTFISENIDGVRVIKAYNKEDKQYKKFEYLNKRVLKNNVTQTTVFALFRPLIYSIHLICVLFILYYGGLLAIEGVILPGIIIAFYSYSSYYFDPIQEIAEYINEFEDSLSSVEKICNILEIKNNIVDTKNPIDIKNMKGKIEFRNVYFRYNEAQDYILKDVSFVINPGESVAFVGPTGGGKSTIINLIERNYEISSGEILIDDVNIKNISLSSLRNNIGLMLQNVYLFNGSIKDNITLFSECDDDLVIEASKKVMLDEIVNKLPDGYDYIVKEKGSNFSSGERQLISFARAILTRPPVMILDEATANIDSKTEQVIQNGLINMSTLGTMIIVAHRLSTIKHSDHIFVISNGRIVEDGNHKELIDKEGMYYNLYISQYKS